MGSDIEKAIQLLMTMLDNNEETKEEEVYDEEHNEIEEDKEEGLEEKVLSDDSDDEIGLASLIGSFSGKGNDKRVTLLSSIKPYMSGRRQEKVDIAINMVKLISITSGLGLDKMIFGDK